MQPWKRSTFGFTVGLITLIVCPSVATAICTPQLIEASDADIRGRLEAGDCRLLDGAWMDAYHFRGRRGQVVVVTVRPLDESYAKPRLTLSPPDSGDLRPPTVAGGTGGATVRYRLDGDGTWAIVVTTDDLFGSGDYVLHFNRYADDAPPDVPQSCIPQTLLCGQTAEWQLSSESCRLVADERAYAEFSIYAVHGDTLTFTQQSLAFAPIAALYRGNDVAPVATSESGDRSTTLVYFVTQSGWHRFVATTSGDHLSTGRFTVTLNCHASGCTSPYFVIPPADRTIVPRGTPATISFVADAVGGFTARLLDASDLSPSGAATSSQIQTPPITHAQSFVLELNNACGMTSAPLEVGPDGTRRRAVRK